MAPLAESHSLWNHAPFVASLWELMDKIAPVLFSGTFASLTKAELLLRNKWRVSEQERDNIRTFTLLPAKTLCEVTGLTDSIKACDRAIYAFTVTKGRKLPFELAERLLVLREAIQSELNHRLVLIVRNGREGYWQNPILFGNDVHGAFSSATFDIMEAGSCLVSGRNNASAYHLMMAVEIGLRCLAADRRAEVTQFRKTIPVEFAQWGQIIGAIEKKVDEIDGWSDRSKKAQAQQYYRPLLLDLNGFCDGYRNHLSHGRGLQIKDDEALALMGHVKRFLSRLSERIGEGRVTPEVW
jgi:hypothetical protein